MTKLKPIELRNIHPQEKTLENLKRNDIYFVLDNIMDTYNIGTAFRLADAVAVKKMYLCGISQKPPNTKVKKSSINTWKWIDWEHVKETKQAIDKLRKDVPDIKIIAVEQSDSSIPYAKANYGFPVALVVGHETKGIPQDILDLCDTIVEMPMYGVNISLNVIVSLSIASYKALEFNNL